MAAEGAGFSLIVIDASVLAPAVLFDDVAGTNARSAIAGIGTGHAPQLVYAEVLSHIRRVHRSESVDTNRCERAIARAIAFPMTLHDHDSLLTHAWRLRDRCSAYDALYVALAQLLDAPLLTADARLARAASELCSVQLVDASD